MDFSSVEVVLARLLSCPAVTSQVEVCRVSRNCLGAVAGTRETET